ncbi:peptidoglycan-binding protein LysM [Robertkochia sp. 1368]|nr:peptidoglycan-binding protein LysM [Robertkochia sediminum]MBL7473694.1 peptidoglycan-binding protein LysM [Robertkochia sediminum]
MEKQAFKLPCLIAVLIILLSFGFTQINKAEEVLLVHSATQPLNYEVAMTPDENTEVAPPFLGRSFNGFKEALAHSESRGNYFVVNSYGYMGKYQFGASAMKAVGVKNKEAFLHDPEMQERAFEAILQRNKWILREYIDRYAGQTIGGVKITESGILAAAHLGGALNVKRFLRSYGEQGFEDAFGTSIRYYMKKFAGYDVSHIKPMRRARI